MQTGSLGDTVFETSSSKIMTPQSFSMSRDANYEDHQCQGTWPRPEFLAPGLAQGSIAITLRRDLGCDPFAEAEKLEAQMAEGAVMRLVIAGKNLGKWTIRKISQDWKYAMRNESGPMSINLTLELKEYI